MTSALAQVAAASRIRRPLAPLQAGTPIENFATSGGVGTWDTFNSNGSVVKPTAALPYCTINHSGAAGTTVKIAHKGTGVSFGGLTAAGSWVTFELDLVDGLDAGDALKFTFSSDQATSKSISTSVSLLRYTDGRMSLTFPCAATQWTGVIAGEVFDGTTFNYWAVSLIKNSSGNNIGVSKQVILRSITFNSMSRPKFVVTYDYGYSGVYNYAKDLHATYNVPGTVNVTNAAIDGAGCMTTAQLQELHGLGWAMAIRSNQHHDQYADFQACLTAMSDARKWNIDRGLTRGADHSIYNTGIMMPFSRAALQAAGIKTGRTTLTSPKQITPEVGRTDMYNLPTCGFGSGNTDTFNSFVKADIDLAIAEGKSMILFTHDIGPGNTLGTSGSTQNDLANILQYLGAKRDANLCDLMTINDWYDSLAT